MLALWKKSYDKSTQCINKQRHYFANKGPYSQSYGFSSSHVRVWELDHKEGWAPKNWCFQTVVLEKTLEIPLDCKEIKPANPEGNQPWIFTGRTDSEVEAPILWPHNVKRGLVGKGPEDVKDKRQEEKGTTEDEMVGMVSSTRWTWVWATSGRWWRMGEAWRVAVHIIAKSLTWLKNWTTTTENEKNLYYLPTSLGFPGSSDGKASAYNVGDPGSIPGSGRSPGEGNGNPLQYSCPENPMDWGAWGGYSPRGCKESDTTVWLQLSSAQLMFLAPPYFL